MQFRPGDRVQCADSHDYEYVITKGAEYEVVSVSDCGTFLRIIRDDGVPSGYHKDRFVLAEPIAKQQEPTARAILDLDRKPLTERQQQIGENIARAVEAMTHNSLMSSYRRGEW